MRRVLLPVALACGFAAAVVGATPGAASASGSVDQQAWAETSLVATFIPQANTLYVAQNLGVEEARAFLHVDPSAIPAGTSDAVQISVAEAPDTNVVSAGGLLACALTTPLVASGQVSGDAAPNVDCTSAKHATRAANGTWTVPIAGLVGGWRAGTTFGVALVPDPAQRATFRIGFDAAKTSLTLPAAAVATVTEAAPTDVATAADLGPAPLAGALTGGVIAPDNVAAGPATTPDLRAAPTLPITDVQRAAATPAGGTGRAASPPAAVVLSLVALAVLGLGLAARRLSPNSPRSGADVHPSVASSLTGWGLAALVAIVLPTLLGEAPVFKLGLVLILFVGAIGLHVLVNWAGELSLAHAAMVGLPAFVVAKLSADHHVSPLVLLPLGLLVGLLVGALVGLPAIRARGLQVALVTLAAGVAIDRFFFTKAWLVGGDSGAEVSVPRLGPFTFATARSLYPVLMAVVVAAVVAALALHRSKVGRALLWVKANPDAAAAFGVPVAAYRIGAYALAGSFAGLAGGLTAAWVGRLTPTAFPLSKSFTFLIIVAIAGRGFVGGVAAAATLIEGGRLFLPNADAVLTYGAPLGLIVTLTRHPTGLNGFGRQMAARLRSLLPARERTSDMDHQTATTRVRPLLLVGAVVLAVGLAAIALAWYHAGNTSQVWVQNQELISGGLGGLALVVVGVGLLVSDGVLAARARDAARWERLISVLEERNGTAGPLPRRRQRDAA
jgi:ABC-type branched-subunit amino acid transport system permease subunit